VGAARGQFLALEGEGVQLPLAQGEPAADRDRPRQVGRPALTAGADVHDEQVPVGEDAVVAEVVRVTVWRPSPRCGRSLAVRSLALEDALDHGLTSPSRIPGRTEPHHLELRRRRDPHRVADRLLPRERRRAGAGAAVTPAGAERGGDKGGPREPEPCHSPGGGWGHTCLWPECTPRGAGGASLGTRNHENTETRHGRGQLTAALRSLQGDRPEAIAEGLEYLRANIGTMPDAERRRAVEEVCALFYVDTADRPDLQPILDQAVGILAGQGPQVVAPLLELMKGSDIKSHIYLARTLGTIGLAALPALRRVIATEGPL